MYIMEFYTHKEYFFFFFLNFTDICSNNNCFVYKLTYLILYSFRSSAAADFLALCGHKYTKLETCHFISGLSGPHRHCWMARKPCRTVKQLRHTVEQSRPTRTVIIMLSAYSSRAVTPLSDISSTAW